MNSMAGLLKPCYVFAPRTLLRRVGLMLSGNPGPRQRVRLPWGAQFDVNIEETIGREVFRQNIFDVAVSELAWRLLAPGDVAVDVGANIGYMTSLFAARVGSGGKVDSFEPHPAVFESLQKNVALAASTARITLHNCALGDRSGSARLVEPDAFGGNEGMAMVATADVPRPGKSFDVRMEQLDTALPPGPIALMKIDVEGFEAQVLEGGKGLLAGHSIRNIIYEAHDCERSPLHALLEGYGYSIYGIGYTLTGLKLSKGTQAPAIARAYESPSYLATLDAGAVLPRLRSGGWQVLRNQRQPASA